MSTDGAIHSVLIHFPDPSLRMGEPGYTLLLWSLPYPLKAVREDSPTSATWTFLSSETPPCCPQMSEYELSSSLPAILLLLFSSHDVNTFDNKLEILNPSQWALESHSPKPNTHSIHCHCPFFPFLFSEPKSTTNLFFISMDFPVVDK